MTYKLIVMVINISVSSLPIRVIQLTIRQTCSYILVMHPWSVFVLNMQQQHACSVSPDRGNTDQRGILA